jgi:hypothetical protein
VDVTTSTRRAVEGPCPFCGRRLALTFHHLVPRKMHRRPRFRRRYTREELARGIYVCRDCHDFIHRTYCEKDIAGRLSTPQALVEDPILQRHFRWLRRQRRR